MLLENTTISYCPYTPSIINNDLCKYIKSIEAIFAYLFYFSFCTSISLISSPVGSATRQHAIPSISKRLFILSLGIKIWVKNYPPTTSLIRYLNIDLIYFGFLASQR
jgi:hypothetical protein